ncbi:MAG: hypothetical protein Q8P92_01185 [Candidatus Daviesbacteria bacterium]|nr:hypothetical protein [Candidatus Daviesbacteria bacterium]
MTLTQTAIIVKQLIFFSIIFLILAISGFLGYRIWTNYNISQILPPEEKADLLFGKLPEPNFPKASVSSSNFSYSIDTVTGNLPTLGEDPGFDKLIKVFFIPKPYATLLAPDKSKFLAQKLNIVSEPQILSETQYRFEDLGKTLTVDLDSGNFKFTNNILPEDSEGLDPDEQLINDFKKMLNSLDTPNQNIGEEAKVIALKNEADHAQISLWPNAIDGRTIYTPDFNKSLVNATVKGSARELANYLSINLITWQIDETTFATYPTKLPQQAFEDLKLGRGVVVIEPDKSQVSITSVSLGYYLTDEYSAYLLPIYIFEGPQFVSYVSAIQD